MNFPREEVLRLEHMTYVEEARWRLFKDIDDAGAVQPGLNVLLTLGDHYTVMASREFRRLAERILAQLPQERLAREGDLIALI